MINITRKSEIKVGIVTIVSIVLFIIGLILAKNIGVTAATSTVIFKFNNSGGLKQSDPIVINGVERGSVTYVFNHQGFVVVLGEIDNINDIKKDAFAEISMLELTGGKKVEIRPGTSAAPLLLSDTIPGVQVVSFPELISDANVIFKDLKILIRRLDTSAVNVNKILADESLMMDVRSIITSTKEATASLNSFIQQNKPDLVVAVKNLKSASESLNGLLKKSGPKADSALNNVNGLIISAEKLLAKTDNLEENLNELLKNYNTIALDIQNGNGTISTLLYDVKFRDELQKSLTSIKTFIDLIKAYGINVNVRVGTKP